MEGFTVLLNSEINKKTVRTELVEVQSLVRSNKGERTSRFSSKCPSSIRKCAALPFDRLRANGSNNDSEIEKFAVKTLWPIC
jgi:hypothetical protein